MEGRKVRYLFLGVIRAGYRVLQNGWGFQKERKSKIFFCLNDYESMKCSLLQKDCHLIRTNNWALSGIICDNREITVKSILPFHGSLSAHSHRKSPLHSLWCMIIQQWTTDGSESIDWACSVTSFEPSIKPANLLCDGLFMEIILITQSWYGNIVTQLKFSKNLCSPWRMQNEARNFWK